MVTSGRRGSWFSRGKLLLTGEYVVLKGAAALALPVKFGQGLEWWGDRSARKLEWDTFVKGEKWFSAVFTVSGDGYAVESSSDATRAGFIVKILNAAARLTHERLPAGRAESSVGFDMGWGLGSSSTLISNIAWLFDVNPFALHFMVSEGSGYDIACARSDMPLVYRLEDSRPLDGRPLQDDRPPDESPVRNDSRKDGPRPDGPPPPGRTAEAGGATDAEKDDEHGEDRIGDSPMPVYRHISFNPPFSGDLYFAYTGRKQDSAGSVAGFLSGAGAEKSVPDNVLGRISEITAAVTEVTDADSFVGLLEEHDRLIGSLTGALHPREGVFAGFPGYVKPLGAWGGDFVLVTWKEGYGRLKNLLEQKGIDVVLPWDKIIYNAVERE